MGTLYEIRVRHRLDLVRSDWFQGWNVIHDEEGNTILRGAVEDQAALHGVLARVRDLGLILLSLHRADGDT
ncbi:MAG: hypothetical protein JXB35_16995 [Anaerolineae bacterium]|nr:hypothetical protein [Anaerolineae bacterium]